MKSVSIEKSEPKAGKSGVDLDLVDTNLSLSYQQRLEHHQSALDLINELSRARMLNEAKS